MTNTTTQQTLLVSSDAQALIKKRIASIDILRGVVMLLMLVDHVRERFFYHHTISDPITISDTSTELFFTRMSAHLCAPVFVFLTGLSAWLYAHPHNATPRSASSFLFKRGLFVILIECTLINFSWFGYYETLYLQVMWAIGASMLVLSLLSKMNYWCIGAVGLIIVFGHNALAPIHFAENEWGYTLWTILHDRGYILTTDVLKIKASYPLLPWIGVILLGYFAGPLYAKTVSSAQRKKYLLVASLSMLALLVLLRSFNVYGETLPWLGGETWLLSFKAFVNFTKYPPSLDFLLLSLGVAGLLLCVLDNVNNKYSQIIERFGAAPMFFYILHLYVLLIGYRLMVAIFGTNQGDYFGVDSVAQVWLIALVLAAVLYYPTQCFANFKKKTTKPWVKYF